MSTTAKPVVVVTGASSGNGRASAHAFAKRGASLVLVARRESALVEAAAECRQLGGEAMPIAADVSDTAAIDAVAARAIGEFGRIDAWVNCAGVLHFGRIEETPPDIIEQVLRTNLIGYFNGTRAAIRQFRVQGRGTLINVSSVLAITAQPYAAAYIASKAGIRAMSDGVRQEVADMPDIKVCTVLPFAIDTPIYQRAANFSGRKPQPVYPRYSPETVADTIVRLLDHPKREVFAGKTGRLAQFGRRLFPRLADKVVEGAIHLIELHDKGAPNTRGNVFEPINDEWKVSGGWTLTKHP